VGGDQLLLLVQGVKEAEGVQPEPADGKERQHQQGGACGQRNACPLSPLGGREHQEWDHEPRRGLHSHASDERDRCRAQPRRGAGGQ
jgi:hypothetical protein